MPATYLSYEPEESDTPETLRSKIFLGIISAGKQAYTMGAAISELRKQLSALDETVARLKGEFDYYKELDARRVSKIFQATNRTDVHVDKQEKQ